jgi:ABC-type transport system involved in multi-copper enzyme maturation permease subunit
MTSVAATPLARPALRRLVRIELRKTVDTRAGFWLLFTALTTTIAAVVLLAVLGDENDLILKNTLALAVQPSSFLLPIVGILLVTSEWSQRTGLITFALVPQRWRVLSAKTLAAVALGLVALVVSILIALPATAIVSGHFHGGWSLPASILGQTAVFIVTGMLVGIAFGAAFLSSAPAIVLSFVLPIVWSALGSIPALEGTARWLDPSRALGPLTDRAYSGTDWAHVGTTLALWCLLPLLIGLWRMRHHEVR